MNSDAQSAAQALQVEREAFEAEKKAHKAAVERLLWAVRDLALNAGSTFEALQATALEHEVLKAVTAAIGPIKEEVEQLSNRVGAQGFAKMATVPFSEIEPGQEFWFAGGCFIKQSEDLVFYNRPVQRPFSVNAIVQVLCRNSVAS